MEEVGLKKIFTALIIENEMLINKICNIYSNNHQDFEDLRQEIVYQLWKSYPSFRNESKIQTWMYRVALNTALYFKRKNKASFFSIDKHYDVVDESEHGAYRDELFDKLYKAIKELDNLDRAIIFLYLEKCTYNKIGEIVGISEKNVSVKLTRIKESLRKHLN